MNAMAMVYRKLNLICQLEKLAIFNIPLIKGIAMPKKGIRITRNPISFTLAISLFPFVGCFVVFILLFSFLVCFALALQISENRFDKYYFTKPIKTFLGT